VLGGGGGGGGGGGVGGGWGGEGGGVGGGGEGGVGGWGGGGGGGVGVRFVYLFLSGLISQPPRESRPARSRLDLGFFLVLDGSGLDVFGRPISLFLSTAVPRCRRPSGCARIAGSS